MRESYDYIVVGGGSSGCVAAAKLVSQGGARVLLLEAGHSHRHPLLDMPPGIFKMINGSKFMRYHQTVPQEHLDNRVHDIPQGNVLGGGSSVNAQVYMRGRPSDYEEWHQLLRGDNDYPGWAWRDVLPHFRGMEGNNRLLNDLHGNEGPLLVSDPGHINEVSRWFVQSLQAMGVPFNHDFNGATQSGVGFYQFMNRQGKRSSAAYAFIAPLAGNSKLTVALNARVSRVEIERGVAKGVIYRDGNGTERKAYAEREVILAAGSLVTPQLLMLSGIGAADHLKSHGLPCHSDLPGVGENLIDHPEVPIIAIANGAYRLSQARRRLADAAQRHCSSSSLERARSHRRASRPVPSSTRPVRKKSRPSRHSVCRSSISTATRSALCEDTYGFTITTVVVKPKSRGTVRLRSRRPG